jgi:hypothetical protein
VHSSCHMLIMRVTVVAESPGAFEPKSAFTTSEKSPAEKSLSTVWQGLFQTGRTSHVERQNLAASGVLRPTIRHSRRTSLAAASFHLKRSLVMRLQIAHQQKSSTFPPAELKWR